MPTAAELHSQIASVMEVLANAAVAEICKAVEDGYAVVNLEMSRSLKENECLRRRVNLLELQVSRYRAEQRLKAPDGAGPGRLFPGVRLLQHRHGRDTPPGSSLQTRTRFLNRPQQKSPPKVLDQDPNQEVVTTTKTEVTELEDDQDLIIVKVESTAAVEEGNNNSNSSTSLVQSAEATAQCSIQTEILESQGNSRRIWRSEAQVVKHGGGHLKTTSPSKTEQTPFSISEPKHQRNPHENPEPQSPILHNTNISPGHHLTQEDVKTSTENSQCSDLMLKSDLSQDLDSAVTENQNNVMSMQMTEPASHQTHILSNELLTHPCLFCPQQFSQKKDLILHEVVHKAMKPYQCDQCEKVFASFCHLKRHKLVHTGARPFPCALCGKKFTTFHNLKVHQSVHTGERKYRCQTCGNTYAFHSNLIRHQASHTKV